MRECEIKNSLQLHRATLEPHTIFSLSLMCALHGGWRRARCEGNWSFLHYFVISSRENSNLITVSRTYGLLRTGGGSRAQNIGRRASERESLHAACMHAQSTPNYVLQTHRGCVILNYTTMLGDDANFSRFPQDSRHIWCGGGGGARDREMRAWNASSAIAALARTWRCGNFKIGKFIYTQRAHSLAATQLGVNTNM